MKIINLPFYENNKDGSQCMQVTMQVVLKHFLHKEYSLEKLDELTGRKKGMWTSTTQIVPVLHDLGLKVKYYSSEDIRPILEGEKFYRKHYGKHAEKILERSDLEGTIKGVKKLIKYKLSEKRKLKFDEIEKNLIDGNIPLMLIDFNKLSKTKGLYQGHFVALTGFDDNSVFYHESGPLEDPKPNKKVSKKDFIDAWNSQGTDNNCVIVYGKI